MLQRLVLCFMLITLTACANQAAFNNLGSSLGLIGAYDAAVTDFKLGRMMEARNRILTIKKDDPEYKKARLFLKQKVNPARLKLLRYYARKGKKEERRKQWAKAEEAYATAVTLSKQPKALLRYQQNMSLKIRQIRFNRLKKLRTNEDSAWLKWKHSYQTPSGLSAEDDSFALARTHINRAFDEHTQYLWSTAKYFERKDLPEIAWLYANAYLVLLPESEKAQLLRKNMATVIPKGIKLVVPLKRCCKKKRKKTIIKKVRPSKPMVSKAQVTQLMGQQKWLSARSVALKYQQQGAEDAAALLVIIEAKNRDIAHKDFENGNLAFRLEHIDQAVSFWQKAAKRMPQEQKFADSLRRGKIIQERLNALQAEESPVEKNKPVEE